MGTPVVGSWRDADDDLNAMLAGEGTDGEVQWGGDVSVTVTNADAATAGPAATTTSTSTTPTAATATHTVKHAHTAASSAANGHMHGSSPSSSTSSQQQSMLLPSSSSPPSSSSSSASPLFDVSLHSAPGSNGGAVPAPALLSVPASARARPRSISRASSSLLHSLSRLGLEWHTTPEANLMYALRAVGGISVKADKTLLIMDTGPAPPAAAAVDGAIYAPSAPAAGPGRILMVEKESALKAISFESVVSVAFDPSDPSARTLKIVYWFDPKSGTTGRIPGAKQYLLQLALASRNDSRDVAALLHHVMKHPLPPPPRSLFTNPALPSLPGGLPAPAEFVCLHSGWLEKRGRMSWSRRFGRLYPSARLVIFRTDKSVYPVNVMSLVRGVGETNMQPKAMGKDQIGFEPAPAPAAGANAAAGAAALAGSSSSASALAPTSLLVAGAPAAPAIPPPAFFMLRFSSTKERDRWYHAFNAAVECDQPLKQWMVRSKKDKTESGDTHAAQSGAESSGSWGPGMATSAAAANASALAAAAASGASPSKAGGAKGASSSHLAIAIPPRSIQAVGAAGVVGGPSASSLKASASSPRSARATPSSPRSARTPVSGAGKSSQHLALHPSTSAPGSPGGAGSSNSASTTSTYATHTTIATATSSTPTSAAPAAKPVVLTREAAASKAAAAAARASAAASSYYLQLMSLLAAPEISRIAPDSEELIIPLNASCGTVSLTQLLKLGLTSPTSKQGQQTQQTQQPQQRSPQQPATADAQSKSYPTTAFSAPSAASSPLESSAATSFAPPTPSAGAAAAPAVVAPAPSPLSASFNPATHQRISVAGLLRKVNEQQLLFHFYSHFRVHHSALLVRTALPALAPFVERTSEKLLMGLGDKKRGQSMLHIDHLLARYHALIATGTHLLQHSKLLLVEGGGTASGSNSTSSQIGFAFPGFDSQVFDVGRFAIVSPGQMVKGLENSFDELEWSQAMKASCVGKELMQSCADFTSLFESGNQKDQDRARTLMHQAQLEVLHNIALAAHMRGKWAGEKVRLREGDLIPWPSVLTQFEVGGAGSLGAPSSQHNAAGKGVVEYPLPPEECASAVEYSSASSASSGASRPSHGRAHSLNVSSAPFSATSSSAAAASAATDVDLFQYSRNHMQLEQWLELVYIYMPSKSLQEVFLRTRMEEWDREHIDPTAEQSHMSANVSLVAAATAAMAAAAAAAAAESTSPAPSPSSATANSAVSVLPSPSSAPPNAAFAALASSPHTHFLFDPFHYLVFLRLLLSARRLALDVLSKAVDRWLDKYPVGHAHRVSAKFSEMSATAKLIEQERRGLVNAMGDLPSPDNMECLLRLKSRLETHQTLQHFLPQRPAANDLAKALILPSPLSAGGAGAGATGGEERVTARLQRKSVIQAHMQSRVAAAAAGAGAAPGSEVAAASAAAAAAASAAAASHSHHPSAQSSVSSIAEGLSEADEPASSTPPSASTTPALPVFASASTPSPAPAAESPSSRAATAMTRLSVEVEPASGAPIVTAALTPNPSAVFSDAPTDDDDDDGAVPPPPAQPHPSAVAAAASSVDLVDAADLPVRSRAPAHADQVMPGRTAPAESVAPPPPPPPQTPPPTQQHGRNDTATTLDFNAILSRPPAESVAPPPPPPALE